MYMVMMVLDNPDKLDDVLDAWYEVNVSGVTILESTGIQRRRAKNIKVPFRYNFTRMAARVEEGHYTLLTVVPTEEYVHACIQAAEKIIGDLDQPNTGILAAWPLDIVKGVPSVLDKKGDENGLG